MDPLDLILLEAWNRVSKKVREDRMLALRRSRRRFRGILTRPMREWCLVIRASDTRINTDNGAILDNEAVAAHQPHTITIDGRLIRELTKPVTIEWPGVTYEEAARICGREHRTMKVWARKGMFKIDYYREHGFPELAHREPPGKKGRGGRPYVWTPTAIDPNNSTGRAPHPVWGTLWQHLWEKMPEEYLLTADRVPIVKRSGRGRDKDKLVFHGWRFECPGRLDANGEYTGCGRPSRYLYGPQTVRTISRAMFSEFGGEEGCGFDLPEDSGDGLHELKLAGQWFPGLSDPLSQAGTRSFACKHCWGVRSACFANDSGWGEFISTISGGLLYGHEVPRPLDICPVVRKMPLYQRPPRKPRPGAITVKDDHCKAATIGRGFGAR